MVRRRRFRHRMPARPERGPPTMSDPITKRRTKRRFAHELYPHAKEDEIRPLAVEVPYLYAQALGFSASEMSGEDHALEGPRIRLLVQVRFTALLADAVQQGLVGDAAWRWACEHMDDSGELVCDRAVHYGVDADRIKPYPCGPLERTDHLCGSGMSQGWRRSAPGREIDCPHCSEPDDGGVV